MTYAELAAELTRQRERKRREFADKLRMQFIWDARERKAARRNVTFLLRWEAS